MSLPVRVGSLGRFARKALESGQARVIAVFERSVYVESPGGLACIGAVGPGPLNAHCNDLRAEVRVIEVGETFEMDLSGATGWVPRPAPDFDAELIGAGLVRLREDAHRRFPSEGFGFVIDPDSDRPALVGALERWLDEPTGPPDAANGLIGLGPGLTPSGDDLVGGALCALHAAGRVETATRLASWALALAWENTNRISRAHLECACEGECGEAVNEALVAVMAGKAVDLDRIHAIGHTSGWDALAGISMALSAVARQ